MIACALVGPIPGNASNSSLEAVFRLTLSLMVARDFAEFEYQTKESWSRSRRVVGKAEMTFEGANPRFVVTSLPKGGFESGSLGARKVYEEVYCARGNMENVPRKRGQALVMEVADSMKTLCRTISSAYCRYQGLTPSPSDRSEE